MLAPRQDGKLLGRQRLQELCVVSHRDDGFTRQFAHEQGFSDQLRDQFASVRAKVLGELRMGAHDHGKVVWSEEMAKVCLGQVRVDGKRDPLEKRRITEQFPGQNPGGKVFFVGGETGEYVGVGRDHGGDGGHRKFAQFVHNCLRMDQVDQGRVGQPMNHLGSEQNRFQLLQ